MEARRHGGSDLTRGKALLGSTAWGRRRGFASQLGRDGSRLRQHGRLVRRAPRWSILGRSVPETGRSTGRRRSPHASNVQPCHRGKERCRSPAIEEPRHEPPSTASAAHPFHDQATLRSSTGRIRRCWPAPRGGQAPVGRTRAACVVAARAPQGVCPARNRRDTRTRAPHAASNHERCVRPSHSLEKRASRRDSIPRCRGHGDLGKRSDLNRKARPIARASMAKVALSTRQSGLARHHAI